jgi:uncharacterized repeat protein (TIGR01451 family)/LPXTG-motif cell wall-anchored protein
MHRRLARNKRPRRLATLAASSVALTVFFALGDGAALAAGPCATPGSEGPGGVLTGVVNTYYAGVGSAAAGSTTLDVGASSGAATPIAAGDMLLVMQMQDADINSTNTDAYGHGPPAATPASGYTALNATGRYEYVMATSGVVAGSVDISGLGSGGGLISSYRTAAATATAGQRTFQVIRVPQHTTATTSNSLTAPAWNGSVGGVLALDTSSTLTLSGTVSVDGLGFRGAPGIQRGGAAGLSNTDVVTSAVLNANGNKGEGIAGTPVGNSSGNGYPGGDAARGAPGNAGGGGTDGRPSNNDQNSGGGGGGNGGTGGQGGNSWSSNLPRGGYGGVGLTAGAARVFLGGGGGAGSTNNSNAPSAGGAAGGGIVLIRAGSIAGSGTISANGADAYNLTANDGGGGGGAGGTIVLTTPSGSLAGATLRANGGRGGNAWATQAGAGAAHGPGGGGGGGWLLTSGAPTSTSITGGANGITTTGNLAYGAAPGQAGQSAAVSPTSIPGVSGGAECADLSVSKSGPGSVTAGGTVSYDVVASNAGPSDADDVSVVDTLPAGVTFVSVSPSDGGWSCTNAGDVSVSCTRASWSSGASTTFTVVVTAPAQAGSLDNGVVIDSSTPDPDPSNNSATAATTVGASADLSVSKSGPGSVTAGDEIQYQILVTNDGPDTARRVQVTDELPRGMALVSAEGPGWECVDRRSATVICRTSSLANGASAPVITIVATAPSRSGVFVNSASVTARTYDPTSTNDAATATTRVTPVDIDAIDELPDTGGGDLRVMTALGLMLVAAGALLLDRRSRRTA